MRIRALFVAAALLAPLGFERPAEAWGATGHRLINRLAATHLPPGLPAFVATAASVDEITALGPEEDVLKGAGTSWDDDGDPAHFVDLGDDGTVYGVSLAALPKDLAGYATALSAAAKTPYDAGYLPYAILDGYEQLRTDFALWRVADFAERAASDPARKAAFGAARSLREMLTVRDIGVWGHYVGDGSQPLHVTIHYNGWGDYPNPQGFSTDRHLHALFESTLVRRVAREDAVAALIPPYALATPATLLTQAQLSASVGAYLAESARRVVPLYRLEAAGDFSGDGARATPFVDAQLAHGAAMLRDLIALAWSDSLNASVGYPAVPVREVLDGRAAAPAPAGSD